MYHVIHCDKHTERDEHIRNMETILGQPISIFKGYCPTSYTLLEDLIQTSYKFKSLGHLGCYFSHHMLIKSLLDKTEGHTVIFEDDACFEKTLHEDILKIIECAPIDFDIILLGNYIHHNTCNHGQHITDNIYKMDPIPDCYGTHALLINNKSLEKIYNMNRTMNAHLDNKYAISIKNGELHGYVIYPILCSQADYGSHTINS